MAIYSLEVWNKGYTGDVNYYDFIGCLKEAVEHVTGRRWEDMEDNTYTMPDGIRYTWIEHSDSGIETDYDLYCAGFGKGCGDFIQHGLECECEDKEKARDPLTEAQIAKS